MKKLLTTIITIFISSASLFAYDESDIGKSVSSGVDYRGYRYENRISSVYVDKYGQKKYTTQKVIIGPTSIPWSHSSKYRRHYDKEVLYKNYCNYHSRYKHQCCCYKKTRYFSNRK